MTEKKPFKLNLWAMSWSSEKKKEVQIEKKEIENKKEILEKTIIKIDDNNVIEKKKIDLSNMLDNKEEKRLKNEKIRLEKIQDKKENENKAEKKKDIVEEDVFINYESDFNKEKTTVLEKIKKFKEYIKPKTRIWFVITIIISTIVIISGLFIIAPQVHNIDNYKKNIIRFKENTICLFNEKQCIRYQNEHKNEEKLIDDKIKKLREDRIKKETIITKETFKEGSFTINYELKKYWNKETIIYKWVEYLTQNDFKKIIEKEINSKKINKLKNHITNKKK